MDGVSLRVGSSQRMEIESGNVEAGQLLGLIQNVQHNDGSGLEVLIYPTAPARHKEFSQPLMSPRFDRWQSVACKTTFVN